MVEVTQADREAAAFAAGVFGTSGTILRDIMNGTCEAIPDEYELQIAVIQAFARHSTNALRSLADDPAMVERAARALCCDGPCEYKHGGRPFSECQAKFRVSEAQAVLRAVGGGE